MSEKNNAGSGRRIKNKVLGAGSADRYFGTDSATEKIEDTLGMPDIPVIGELGEDIKPIEDFVDVVLPARAEEPETPETPATHMKIEESGSTYKKKTRSIYDIISGPIVITKTFDSSSPDYLVEKTINVKRRHTNMIGKYVDMKKGLTGQEIVRRMIRAFLRDHKNEKVLDINLKRSEHLVRDKNDGDYIEPRKLKIPQGQFAELAKLAGDEKNVRYVIDVIIEEYM